MSKISRLLKGALFSALLVTSGSLAHADELLGTYQWNIQYSNSVYYSASDPTADIVVEVYQTDDTNCYIKETGETNIFQGLTIPFTLKGDQATFPIQNIGAVGSEKYVFVQNCYLESNLYMPQQTSQTATFKADTGFAFKANNGFGWYGSSTGGTSFNPNMNVIVAFFVRSQSVYTPPTTGGGDTLLGTYQWNIQYANTVYYSASDPTADIVVEVYQKDDTNCYIKETGETDIFQGLTIPFTLKGDQATFPMENIGAVGSEKYVFVQNCYLESNLYMPQQTSQTATFKADTGFAFKANNGFGWYGSSTGGTSFNPNMNVIVAFFVRSQSVYTPGGGDDGDDDGDDDDYIYPALSSLGGSKDFTASITWLDEDANDWVGPDASSKWLLTDYKFTITPNSAGTGGKIIKFIGDPTLEINFNYDRSTGTIAIPYDNTIGTVSGFSGPVYKLSFGDAEGEPSTLQIHVTEDGQLYMDPFTVVNTLKGYDNATPVARYSNIEIGGYTYVAPEGTDISGDYKWTIAPIKNFYGSKGASIDITVNIAPDTETVNEDENTSLYILSEVGTDYFKGYKYKFAYNDATKAAQFNTTYAGEEDGQPVFFSAFVLDAVTGLMGIQAEYQLMYNPAEGEFEIPGDSGIGLYFSKNSEELDPTDEWVFAYLIGAEPGGLGDEDGENNYPEFSTFYGEHTLTATVTFEGNYGSNQYVAPNFPAEKTFKIENGQLSQFVGINRDINMKYDQSTGQITMLSSNLGSTLDYSDFTNYGFCITDIDGSYTANQQLNPCTLVPWQVTEDGHIIIPDFAIVNYSANGALLVKYTNVKVDGYDPNASVEPEPSYPESVSAIFGTYPFSATIERLSSNSTYDDFYNGLPSSFEFTVGEGTADDIAKVSNFVTSNPNANLSGTYDNETGVLLFKTMSGLNIATGEFTSQSFYIGDAEGNVGIGNNAKYSWQVNTDGTFTIPDFTVCIYFGGQYTPIAKYTNIKLEAAEEPDPDTYPESVSAIFGTYPFSATIERLNSSETYNDFYNGLPSSFEFTVGEGTADDIAKVSNFVTSNPNANLSGTYDNETGVLLFKTMSGLNIATGEFTSQSFYIGDAEGNVGIGNNAKYSWQVNTDGTFTIPDFTVCIYFGGQYTPIAKYTDIKLEAAEEPDPDTYPESVSAIFGTYPFSATIERLSSNSTYDDFYNGLPSSFEFTVGEGTADNIAKVSNFVTSNPNANLSGTYNNETGVLLFNTMSGLNIPTGEFTSQSFYIGDAEGNVGIGNNAKYSWQVNTDGTFTIPDFTVCIYFGGQYTPIAKYTNIKLEAGGNEEGTIPTTNEIVGTYSFKASDFELKYPELSNLYTADFEFSISSELNYMDEQVIKVSDFLFEGNTMGSGLTANQATYDEETGLFTFSGFTLANVPNPVEGARGVGIAPEGEWNGISAATAIKLTMQFNADGTVTMPDFDVIGYNGSTNSGVIAHYGEISLTKQDENGGGEGGDEGDGNDYSFLAGIWNAQTYSYAAAADKSSYNGETFDYHVTVEGNTVTFTEYAEGYEGIMNLTAKASIDEDGQVTLDFGYAAVGAGSYPMRQCPWIDNTVNADNWEDLALDQNVVVTAVYDPEAKTITFPEGSGFRYAYINNAGQMSTGWFDAVYFRAPLSFNKAYSPELTITLASWDVENPSTITFTLGVETNNFDNSQVARWEVKVYEVDMEENVTEFASYDVTLENDQVTFTVDELVAGDQAFRFILNAYNAEGELYAASNEKAWSGSTTPQIMTRGGNCDTETDNEVKITLTPYYLTNFTSADAQFKIELKNTIGEDEVEFFYADAVLTPAATTPAGYTETGSATAIFTNLPDGAYTNLTAYLVAYDNGVEIARASNGWAVPAFNVSTGIDSIEAEIASGKVRYFNLNGVEVTNPSEGVYIRVEGNKASKVLIK